MSVRLFLQDCNLTKSVRNLSSTLETLQQIEGREKRVREIKGRKERRDKKETDRRPRAGHQGRGTTDDRKRERERVILK